jgi:hypothetical protein
MLIRETKRPNHICLTPPPAPQSTYMYTKCLSPRRIKTPHPLSRKRVCPPGTKGGGVPIRTTGEKA